MSHSSDRLAIHQRRKVFALALNNLQSKVGLGTPELRAQWATPVYGKKLTAGTQDQSRQDIADDRGAQGHTWKGYWIPFKDQIHRADQEPTQQQQQQHQNQHDEQVDLRKVNIGENCDLVVLYAHGGGFIDGYPLQSLEMFRRVMKQGQKEHNLKIAFLTMDYSMCPDRKGCLTYHCCRRRGK